MASTYKYMAKTYKAKVSKIVIENHFYPATLTTKTDLIKALKNIAYDISKGIIENKAINVLFIETGKTQTYIYGKDFTAKWATC